MTALTMGIRVHEASGGREKLLRHRIFQQPGAQQRNFEKTRLPELPPEHEIQSSLNPTEQKAAILSIPQSIRQTGLLTFAFLRSKAAVMGSIQRVPVQATSRTHG